MRANKENGVALISAMLVLMLMSALLVAFVAMMTSDQRASGMNRDHTQAYAAAHAGVEKLTTDLGQLFQQNFSPTGTQVNTLAASTNEPVISGMRYYDPNATGTDGYRISFIDSNSDGNPDLEDPNGTMIPTGPYNGLIGLITPYTIDVSAHTTGDAEVRMRRTIQTVAIPVFQFGIFSENDLSFFAGPNFAFGGRVHTNQNLYLGQGNGTTLTLADKVTAVGEVVRTHLSNGQPLLGGTVGPDYDGTVRMALAQNCPAAPAAITANCRNLRQSPNEGSVTVGSVPPSVLTWIAATPGHPAHWEMVLQSGNTANDPWTGLSIGTYNKYILNGRTGAKRLDLPIVDAAAGTTPVDIIRRPRPGDSTADGTPYKERFYTLASFRVLLSDTAADITGLPGIGPGAPIDLTALTAAGYVVDATHAPIGTAGGSTSYAVNSGEPLIRGFIKIERQTTAGAWQDVTLRVLNLGFTGRNLSNGTNWAPDTTGTCSTEPNPDAIIRIQRLRDQPSTGGCGNGSTTSTDYWPNVIYDPREGARREQDRPANLYLGGTMSYVELDVNNLKRWLEGTTDGGFGAGSMNITGYVFYFSDRRGNRDFGPDGVPLNTDDLETSELGFENFVNASNAATGDDDTVFDTGENVNNSFSGTTPTQDTYGGTPRRPSGFKAGGAYDPTPPATLTLRTLVTRDVARRNPPAFFRRALKIVNGARGQLPFVNRQGLTIASENPAYVQGNFNACESSMGSCTVGFDGVGTVPLGTPPHVSASVIADTVTLLSRSWNDLNSFNSPHAVAGRQASTTFYRLGIISGKGLSFPRPNDAGNPKDYGTDGGAHNFLRYIEDWGGETLNYRGSIISLYINRQAVGTYKCCGNVYSPPTRGYNFEQEFLSPQLLPPRTPMFRDINTLTFRQVLRPTEP